MATGFDPEAFQQALVQIAAATQQAASAAQSAAQAVSSAQAATASGSPTTAAQSNVPKANVDWSKLLNKPAVFGEGKSVEDDVKSWGLPVATTPVFGGDRRGL